MLYGSPEDEVTYGYIQEFHCRRLSDELVPLRKSLEEEIEHEKERAIKARENKLKNHIELRKILNKNSKPIPVKVKRSSNINAIKAYTAAISSGL